MKNITALAPCIVIGLALAACGEDPILLAEILAASGSSRTGDPPSAPPADQDESVPLPIPAPADDSDAPAYGQPEPPGEQAPSNPLEAPALDILGRHCSECHGGASSDVGLAPDILDLDALIATGMIIRGSRFDSPVYARMLFGSMPPEDVIERPTPEEIELVGAYIDSLDVPELDSEP